MLIMKKVNNSKATSNNNIKKKVDETDKYMAMDSDEIDEKYFENVSGYENNNDDSRSIEVRRVDFLRNALKKKMGIEDVEEEMKNNQFRELYVRNPVENILKYCFMYNSAVRRNETSGKLKDLTGFKELVDKLGGKKVLKNQFKDEVDIEWTVRANGYVTTMRDLKKYILLASNKHENTQEKPMTSCETQEANMSLYRIDFSSRDPDKEYTEYFNAYKKRMADASCSMKYYFVKYLYFFVYNQVLEFINILKKISISTPEEFYNNTYEWVVILNPNRNPWSIEEGIVKDSKIDQILFPLDPIVDYNQKNSLIKALINASMDNLPIMHSNIKCDDAKKLSPLFQDIEISTDDTEVKGLSEAEIKEIKRNSLEALLEKGNKDIIGKVIQLPISKLVNRTQLFKNPNRNSNVHYVLRDAISKLSPDDFDSYPINLRKLYMLLFEQMLGKVVRYEEFDKEEIDDGSKYIKSVICDQYDMTRSALLIFLASIKGGLSDCSLLLECNEVSNLFEEKHILNIDRVNSILKRVGYVELQKDRDHPENKGIDEAYSKVFECDDNDQLNNFIFAVGKFYEENNNTPLPFDIAQISSKKAKAYLMEGRGVKLNGNKHKDTTKA
jgi:hypothetical protein